MADLCTVTPAEEAKAVCKAMVPEPEHGTKYALRCFDCNTFPVYCRECMISQHRLHPYHRISIARPGNFCEATTLSKQGYVFHLHPGNRPCTALSTSIKYISKFVIVDSGSIHTFSVQTCACTQETTANQLIATGLFPATFSDPRTAFTFDALDYYLLDNTICHTTAYSFHEKLRHRTNPLLAFAKETPVSEIYNNWSLDSLLYQHRYRELLRTSRMWMDVETRLRSGYVHDPDCVSGPGSLALSCVTCPSEHNRQDNWQQDPRR
jgi:hypothetical protein